MTPQDYEQLPEEVKGILNTFDEDEDLYAECNRIGKELEAIGYESDYDLSGSIVYVRKAS